jgi:hypothetical protein
MRVPLKQQDLQLQVNQPQLFQLQHQQQLPQNQQLHLLVIMLLELVVENLVETMILYLEKQAVLQ